MNIASIVVLAVIILLAVFAVRRIVKMKLISRCSGNCSGCVMKCDEKMVDATGMCKTAFLVSL